MSLPFEFADLSYQPLSDIHPVGAFSCGDDTVDAWLHKHALQKHRIYSNISTIVLAPEDGRPVAFYVFSARTAKQGQMSKELNEGFFSTLSGEQFPVLSLDWIGVREELRGQGLGRYLMGRTLYKFYNSIREFGTPAFILEAIDQKTEDFYFSLGFRRYGHRLTKRTMLIGAKPVIALFDK